jgi:hypothetical protein
MVAACTAAGDKRKKISNSARTEGEYKVNSDCKCFLRDHDRQEWLLILILLAKPKGKVDR